MSSGWRLVFMAPAGNMEAEADRTPVLTLPEISSKKSNLLVPTRS
jgi:hypothetical protein